MGTRRGRERYRRELARLKRIAARNRALLREAEKSPAAPRVAAAWVKPAWMKYHACEDALFPGVWRAEPVNYDGHGCVYLFYGPEAQREAADFAAEKNGE